MLNVKVVYEESGEDRRMTPIWMIVDSSFYDWEKILFIDIQAPFERLTFDEMYSEREAVTVPDIAYTRHIDNEHLLGISLSIVREAVMNSIQPKPTSLDLSSIQRIVLRICDIEDTLQYSLRGFLTY
ncbi:hypothetical protein [Bacillus sp. FJAT-28004]|uniref:hypothetical protein n=1 Tax=Bacillus sp. FJAT-28004 TaxID=1679165 RepID=UPI0006B4E258|nr:hypothetical protein [Bacillus sp. FJAT-28004]